MNLGDVKSGWLKLEKGAPQGPLAYNIFTNDLPFELCGGERTKCSTMQMIRVY